MKISNVTFSEISMADSAKLFGGGYHFQFGGLISGLFRTAAIEIITDWDNFVAGLTGKPENK